MMIKTVLTLFILMDFFYKHIDTISMGWCIYVWDIPLHALRGHRPKFLNYNVFLSIKIVFILANSEAPDEMTPYAAFYLGLYYLPKNQFNDIQNE